MRKITSLFLCFSLGVIVMLTGCSNQEEPFTDKNYTSGDEQILGVVLDVRDRQIEVLPSEDQQVHIDYSENSKESYELTVSEDHVLTMTAVSDKEWTDYIGEKAPASARKITVQLPDTLLQTLQISTTNEDISVTDLSLKDTVSLTTNGGAISFDQLSAGNTITLDAKNGDITGTISGSYEEYSIYSSIKKGDSNLPASKDQGSKTLSVTANNGDISVEFNPK